MASTPLDTQVGRPPLDSLAFSNAGSRPTAPGSSAAHVREQLRALLGRLDGALDGRDGALALTHALARRLGAHDLPALRAIAAGDRAWRMRLLAWDLMAAVDPQAGAAIARALTDGRERAPAVVLHLARLLRHGRGAEAAETLARALARIEDEALASRLVVELRRAGPIEDLAPLGRRLASAGPALRRALLSYLAEHGSRDEPLVRVATLTRSAVDASRPAAARVGDLRALASVSLSVARGARVGVMLDALEDEASPVRLAAVDGLARLGARSEVAALARDHEDASVRARATVRLQASDPGQLAQLTRSASDDPSPAVRAAAVRRLAGARGDDRREAVRTARDRLMDDADESVRWAAARVLREQLRGERARADEEVLDQVYALARSRSPRIRRSAVGALVALGGARARGRLTELAEESSDARVRARALQALKEIEEASHAPR